MSESGAIYNPFISNVKVTSWFKFVCCSHEVAPTPDKYLYKYDFDAKQNTLEIFLSAGSLNGEYGRIGPVLEGT